MTGQKPKTSFDFNWALTLLFIEIHKVPIYLFLLGSLLLYLPKGDFHHPASHQSLSLQSLMEDPEPSQKILSDI